MTLNDCDVILVLKEVLYFKVYGFTLGVMDVHSFGSSFCLGVFDLFSFYSV